MRTLFKQRVSQYSDTRSIRRWYRFPDGKSQAAVTLDERDVGRVCTKREGVARHGGGLQTRATN